MYRTILVPVDGSATADRGLREALRLAKALRARVSIVHVVEDPFHEALFETASFSPGLFAILREEGAASSPAPRRSPGGTRSGPTSR